MKVIVVTFVLFSFLGSVPAFCQENWWASIEGDAIAVRLDENGPVVQRIDLGLSGARRLIVSPGGRVIFVLLTADPRTIVVDALERRVRSVTKWEAVPRDLWFSEDGSTVAIEFSDGSPIRLFDHSQGNLSPQEKNRVVPERPDRSPRIVHVVLRPDEGFACY